MNPEKQRIAIATACGWKKMDIPGLLMKFRPWIHKDADGEDHKNWKADTQLPDFLSDLNAIHEAVATLKGRERELFADVLNAIKWHRKRGDNEPIEIPTGYIGWMEERAEDAFDTYNASAEDRCEAFLRTIGKWEDGK